MEKEFKEFCSRVRAQRVGVPAARAFPDDVKAEILRWAERKHPDDVVAGAGVARVTINRWRRQWAHSKTTKNIAVGVAAAPPEKPVFHVTRVSVQAQERLGTQPDRVVARIFRGQTSVEFFDSETLVHVLQSGCL